MVSRRATLHLLATGLAGIAGCMESQSTGSPTATPAPVPSPTPSPGRPASPSAEPPDTTTTTPDGLENWGFAWERHVEFEYVLGVDVAKDRLYVTLSDEGGPSGVAAVDPTGPTVGWTVEFEGEATSRSHAGARGIARGGWGVTVADDAVYVVTGRADSYEWTALHALDRSSGETRWSVRRPRRLAVHGLVSDLVVASGREFFEAETTHDTPEEPLTSELYGIDAAGGDVRWTTSFDGVADVGVGPDGVYVAAGSQLVGLALDGHPRFTYDADAQEARTVRVAPDRVYYLAEAGHDRSVVHGLAPDGDKAWERALPIREVLLDGERLYTGGDAVAALDPDGSLAWRHDDRFGQWLLLGPAGETLFSRSGRAQDRAAAYRTSDGSQEWTYRPPTLESPNAWPVAATPSMAVVEGITAADASDPFTTLFAVDREDGEATKSVSLEPVFDVKTVGETVVVAGSSILALKP